MSDITEKTVRFVSTCIEKNEKLLDRFTKATGKYNNHLIKDIRSFVVNLDFPFDLEFLCHELLVEALKNGTTANELSKYIEIARSSIEQRLNKEPTIIPVWTGPVYEDSPVFHRTYETLKQLFQSAQYEILIAGYTFSLENQDVKNLFFELIEAAKRECRIDIIFHNNDSNLAELRNHWPRNIYFPHFYYWKGSKDTPWASLHSKLIMIDQKKLLLTSANFTYHGLKKNIESGVLIENHETVKQLWKQFRALLKNEEMKCVNKYNL